MIIYGIKGMADYFQGHCLNGELLIRSKGLLLVNILSTKGDIHTAKHIGFLRKSTGLWALGGAYVAEVDSVTGLKLRFRRY